MLSLIPCAIVASPGDRDPVYAACVRDAQPSLCSAWEPSLPLALTGWSCSAECSYQCMWRITSQRQAEGAAVQQFHGKWPFTRFLGCQEPAAVLFSVFNGAAHAAGLRSCWELTATAPDGWMWRGFALLQLNVWLWASVFHCRDVYWTQCADYFSATLLIGASTLLAAQHLGVEKQAQRQVLALALLFTAAYVVHIVRMLHFFDYGEHMRLNIVLGVVHLLLWAAWWAATRRIRPHAWRAPAIHSLVAALILLEVGDWPPLWGVLDAHALWHASTVLPALVLWRSFVKAELSWRLKMENAKL